MAGLIPSIDIFHGGNLETVEKQISETGLPFILMSDFVTLLSVILIPSGYQGLLVNGQRKVRASPDRLDEWRPLDKAVFQNDLNMTRWILSDAPSHCFQEYIHCKLSKNLKGASGVDLASLLRCVNFRMLNGGKLGSHFLNICTNMLTSNYRSHACGILSARLE